MGVILGRNGYESVLDKETIYSDGYKLNWRFEGGKWVDSDFNCMAVIADGKYIFASRISKKGNVIVFINSGYPSQFKSIGNIKQFSLNNNKGLELIRLTTLFFLENESFLNKLNKSSLDYFLQLRDLYNYE